MSKKFYIMGIMLCISVLSINAFGMTLTQQPHQENSMTQEVMVTWEADQVNIPLTKEKALQLLEGKKALVSLRQRLMESELTEIALKDIAQVFCTQVGCAPIYLPKEQESTNGYIGRLVVEGLWEGALNPDYLLNAIEGQMLFQKMENYINNNKKINKPSHYKEYPPSYFEKVTLGKLQEASTQLAYKGINYELYSYNDTTYIPISYLEGMGFSSALRQNVLRLECKGQEQSSLSSVKISTKEVVSNTQKVFIGNLLTYSIKVDENIFIPLRALNTYYELILEDHNWNLLKRDNDSSKWVAVDEQHITNIGNESLDIDLVSLFWDGNQIIKEPIHIVQLQPGSAYPNPTKIYALYKDRMYLTTIIERVVATSETLELPYTLCGQNNENYLRSYQKVIDTQEKERQEKQEKEKQEKEKQEKEKESQEQQELFPAWIIIGTIKQDSSGLKRGDKVEIIKAEKGSYYFVEKDNKTIKVPWGNVSIPSSSLVQKQKAKKEQIEQYINEKGFKSKTNYLVWTDLYRQRTYVLRKKGDKWQLYKELLCSTGKNITPTPRGVYSLKAYVPYFGVNKGYRCKNAVQIFEDYLYHSIIFDKTGKYLLEGKGVLGQRASDGCIRFSEEDSLWFYETMPLGTAVWIN